MTEDETNERWVTGRPRSNNPGSISYYAFAPEEIQQVVKEHNRDIRRLSVGIEQRTAAGCTIGESEDESTYYAVIHPEVNKDYNSPPREYQKKNLAWWKSRAHEIEEAALDWARKYISTDKPIKAIWQTLGRGSIPEHLGLNTYNILDEERRMHILAVTKYERQFEIPVYGITFSFSAGPFRYSIELQNWTLDREKVERCNEACNALVREANELNSGKGKFTSEQIKEIEYQMGLIIQREYGLLDENQLSLK